MVGHVFLFGSKEYGLIKMWFTSISRISKSGKTIIEYYVYDPKEWNKIIEHGTEKSSNTLKSIGRDLYMTRDKKQLIDAPIATFEVEESKSAESEPQLTTDRMAAGQWYESLEESYELNWENLIKKLDELGVDWDYRNSSWNPEIEELITIDGQDALALCDDGICYGEELMYWDNRFNVMKLLKTLYKEAPERYPSLKKLVELNNSPLKEGKGYNDYMISACWINDLDKETLEEIIKYPDDASDILSDLCIMWDGGNNLERLESRIQKEFNKEKNPLAYAYLVEFSSMEDWETTNDYINPKIS